MSSPATTGPLARPPSGGLPVPSADRTSTTGRSVSAMVSEATDPTMKPATTPSPREPMASRSESFAARARGQGGQSAHATCGDPEVRVLVTQLVGGVPQQVLRPGALCLGGRDGERWMFQPFLGVDQIQAGVSEFGLAGGPVSGCRAFRCPVKTYSHLVLHGVHLVWSAGHADGLLRVAVSGVTSGMSSCS